MIRLLDCTLRDGGYQNDWIFGKNNIISYVDQLENTCVDIVECGYICEYASLNDDSTLFPSFDAVNNLFGIRNRKNLVAMINFGEFPLSRVPMQTDTCLGGIRLAFHRPDLNDALIYAKELRDKGFYVYLQPMITSRYSQKDFLELMDACNTVHPSLVYIVDSLGILWPSDVLRYAAWMNQNLEDSIGIGFHFHDSIGQASMNAHAVMSLNYCRTMILDTTMCGIGRGGGNLNVLHYLRLMDKYCNEYLEPILSSLDTSLERLIDRPCYERLIFCLTALHQCHPKYGKQIIQKNLSALEAHYFLSSIDPSKKMIFHEDCMHY